ncbi:MAG TPA: autotransporter-associated beta strand repeat-containing protein, partial [Tepidisphaeraceae bacterium]|nr:autotransporter-associated beta strand repeat-containing protein [Tepidisphaeraceae bacterium]
MAGTGTASGLVSVNSGGHVSPGNSIGILNASAFTLNSGGVLDMEFSGTSSSDRINVTSAGGLTLNGGGINVFAEGTTTAFTLEGTYNIFQFNGALNGSVSNLSVLNPLVGYTYTFGTSGNFVTLTIDQVAISSKWAADVSGSWNTTGNWTGGVVPNGVGSIALFTTPLTAPRTVTLDGSKTVGGVIFDSAVGYAVTPGSGGTLTLQNATGLGNAQVVVNSGSHSMSVPIALNSNLDVNVGAAAAALVVSGNISGGNGITKLGPGLLVLSGNNSYTGGTQIAGGTIEVGSSTALGSSAATFTGSALRAGAGGLNLPNNMTIGSGVTAIFDSNGLGMTLSGSINDVSGNGVLRKVGAGTITLAGNATHGGGTVIDAGTLEIGNGGSSGSPGNATITVASGAVIAYNRSDDQNWANVISGAGQLAKRGSGILTLSGNNTYSGGTKVEAGTLRAGLPTVSFGTGTIDLAPGTTLDLDGWETTTGAVSGSGMITNNFPGVVTLVQNVAADTTFAGSFQDGGGQIAFRKAGAANYTLSGSSNFSANVTVDGGTLSFNGPGSTLSLGGGLTVNSGAFRVDSGTVTASAQVFLNNSDQNKAFIVAGGVVNLQGFNIGRNAAATPDYAGGLQVSGGSLTATSIVINTSNSWSTMVQSGGSVSITGASGGFIIGNGNNVGRGGVFRITGGTLTYSGADGMLLSNTDVQSIAEFQGGLTTLEGISVFNAATRTTGFATLSISGGEVYLGSVGITSNPAVTGGGTVILSGGVLGAKADWSSALDMALNNDFGGITFKAADAANAPFNITLTGNLAGAGNVTKTGGGILTVNRLTAGNVAVNAGTLRVTAKGTANDPAGTTRVNNVTTSGTGRLDLNNNSLIVNAGSVSAISGLIKTGVENGGNFDWLGPGIGSTQANVQNTTAGSFLYGLGAILNDLAQVGGTGPIYTDFAGVSGLVGTEVLVKFTYFGDADLSGSIDATDYSLIDNGYVNSLSGWLNGDFDYSGSIDATDYALIDNAYVNQAGPLADALIAQHSQQFGGEYVAALRAVQSG